MIKNKFDSEFVEELSLESLVEYCNEKNISFGYIETSGNWDIKIALNKNICMINEDGEIYYGTGHYKEFLDIDSSVTMLENTIKEDMGIILNKNLDIICLGKIEFNSD